MPGNYDGDAKTDLAVARRSAASTGAVTWYVLRSLDGALAATPFGITEYDTPVQNDYDGDGRPILRCGAKPKAIFIS